MIVTNSAPTYHAQPYHIPETGERVPHVFAVYEWPAMGGVPRFCFKMDNREDRANNILRHGVPSDQLRRVFYEMDGI